MSTNRGLLADVSFQVGDGHTVMSILHGTYDCPPETDQYIRLLFLDATTLFSSLGEDGVEDFVTREDYQSLRWVRASREETESSKSRCYFSHYRAGAHNNTISQLHTTSLNTIRKIGVAPSRWHCSLTVLLEKVSGVRLVHKLQAICLIEADFNWLNKLLQS
jgi:hypothetical protein